jgi:hypothetical protein
MFIFKQIELNVYNAEICRGLTAAQHELIDRNEFRDDEFPVVWLIIDESSYNSIQISCKIDEHSRICGLDID